MGWVPGMIHAWYIILSNPDVSVIDDEERQIFIVTPPDTTHVTINKQPNQTKIKFNHPEPFLENNRYGNFNNNHNHNHNPNHNRNNYNNLDNADSDNNNTLTGLSPLSHTPLIPSNLNNRVASPLSNPQNVYGAADEEIDPNFTNLNDSEYRSGNPQSNDDAPPSYDNVMNESLKQYR